MASLTTINQVLKAVPESSVSNWGPSLVFSEKGRKPMASPSARRSSSTENVSQKGSERPPNVDASSSRHEELSNLNAKMDQVLQLMDNFLGRGPGLPAMLESFLTLTERLDKSVTLLDQMMQSRTAHEEAPVKSESDSILQERRAQEQRVLDWASKAPEVLCAGSPFEHVARGKQKRPSPRPQLLLPANSLPAPCRGPLSPKLLATSKTLQSTTDPAVSSSSLASKFRTLVLQEIFPTPHTLPNMVPAAAGPSAAVQMPVSALPLTRLGARVQVQPRGHTSPAMTSPSPKHRSNVAWVSPRNSSPSDSSGSGSDADGACSPGPSIKGIAPRSPTRGHGRSVMPLETRRRENNQRIMSKARRSGSLRGSQEASPPPVLCDDAPVIGRTSGKSSLPLATVTSHEEDLVDVWRAMESRLPVTTQRLKQLLTAAADTATAASMMADYAWLTALSPAHKLLLLGATLRPKQQATSRCGLVLLGAQKAAQVAVGAAILASAAWLVATPCEAALSRRLLGAAVLLALPLSWWAARRHRQNRGHLRQFGRANGFIEKWDSQSATSAFCSMLLWLAVVGLQMSDESTPQHPHDAVAFAFVSLGVVVVVHGIVSSCLGLILFIDSYCHTIGEKRVHAAMEQWNVVQASTRDFGETLQTTIALLMCTFISCTVALVVDAKRDAKVMILPVLPSAVLLVAIARVLVIASRVTEKCSKVSSFVNSLEGFDRGRQHLVEYIRSSGAGFYIFEVCFTGTIAWRCFYSSGTLAFLGSQILATLGSIQG